MTFFVLPPTRTWSPEVEALGQALANGARRPQDEAAVSLLVRLPVEFWARPDVVARYRYDEWLSATPALDVLSEVVGLHGPIFATREEVAGIRAATWLAGWQGVPVTDLEFLDDSLKSALLDAMAHVLGVTR